MTGQRGFLEILALLLLSSIVVGGIAVVWYVNKETRALRDEREETVEELYGWIEKEQIEDAIELERIRCLELRLQSLPCGSVAIEP